MTDWHDSEKLNDLANTNVGNARRYFEDRLKYSESKFKLDVLLAQAYMNGDIESKVSYEKAMLLLISGPKKEETEPLYRQLLHYENSFKGLERVIEANKDKLVLSQSLIKNKNAETR